MKNSVLITTCLLGVLTGCISLGTYEKNMRKSVEKENALNAQIADLQAKIKSLEQDIQDKEEKLSSIQETYDSLTRDLQQDINEGSVGVKASGKNLTITVGDAVLFRSGSAELQAKGQQILQKVSNSLKDVKDRTIRIDGHSDNVPISGALKARFPSNWDLSAARAASVARSLQDMKGIDPTHLMVAAFADTTPVADNATPQGRAQNRRVEITLVPNKPEPGEMPATPIK